MPEFRRLALMVACAAVLLAPLEGRTRKGEKLLQQGRDAEARKQWEIALDFYEQAMLEDPADAAYQLAMRRVRFQAASARVDAGQKLRAAGRLEEALVEFQRGYAIDPSSAVAEQEIRLTKEMIERENVPETRSATPEERGLTPAEKVQREAEERAGRMLPVPELRPIQRQISTLKMNNQPVRVLYETVGKLAGINVIFDADYQAGPGKSTFTVDLSNTTLEEALDYLAVQTRSYWKPLSANAIFVTNDNVTKRRDFEDYVVKVFYIKNATSVQELQEISTTVRSVTEIRRAFTYNAQNAILVRGTADQVALADKLIQDLDKPKAEVVVDIYVMEANRGRVRDLASTFTTGSPSAAGINLPVIFNRGATTTPGTPGNGSGSVGDDPTPPTTTTPAVPLNQLDTIGLGDYSINMPGALLQALMSDSTTRLLQNPQVRAVENYKASLKIGDRIPYATGSFQPGIGGAGLNPLVSTQFNFLDTGVNVDLTPKVHGRDEISMQVEIDVSAKSGEVELGGLRQPSVSRRTINHSIRIREGEISLLGGLLGTQESRIRSGVPWLMDIPGLGRLFSTEKLERSRGELLIVLVPHIVRTPEYSESNLRGVSAGNDQNVKLNYAPRRVAPAPTTVPQGPAAGAQPQTAPTPGQTAPEPAPAPVPPAPEAAAAVGPQLLFGQVTAPVQPGAAVPVTLRLENVTDLFSAPLRIRFDPKVLRLTGVSPGPLMTGDGQKINFNEQTLNDTGEAIITLNRLPGAGGVTGSGILVNLNFQALAAGTATVSVVNPDLKNLQMQSIAVPSPAATITVQ
ncbi:MAG TPA: cohesin domain-containing protein [Bryobacteraceae bacterium]|nr:cohesin domain-containing protein [Bryobacteraceae bacterium]